MLPIKLRDDDVFLSDYSLFTLVDKETQTESDCASEQKVNILIRNPYNTVQDEEYAKVKEYCQILSESGIFDTNIRIENVTKRKQGVLSAKSSHGTFLIGNIFKREGRTGRHSNKVPVWKLDESFQKEYPNSGYIYIPCYDPETNSEQGSHSNGCVFIPNQQTNIENDAINTENTLIISQKTSLDTKYGHKKEYTDADSLRSLTEKTYLDPNKSKEKELNHVSFTNNPTVQNYVDTESTNETECTNINFINNPIEQDYYDTESNNLKEFTKIGFKSTPIEQTYLETKNSKEKETSRVGFISNPIKEAYLDIENSDANELTDEKFISNSVQKKSIDIKNSKEKQPTRVSFINTDLDTKNSNEEMPDENPSPEKLPDTCSPSEMRSKRINYIAQGLKNCLSSTISVIMDPICGACSKFNELKTDKKKEEVVAKTEHKPDECSNNRESMPTTEPLQLVPLNNEIESSSEFANKDVVFVSNDQRASVKLDAITDQNTEDTTTSISKHVADDLVKLTATASCTTDDVSINMEIADKNAIKIEDESVNEIQVQPSIKSKTIMSKLMGAVESTVTSLKEHIDLDRISNFRNKVHEQKHKEESSDDEQLIRTVHPNPVHHNRSCMPPPPRSMFTSFKSTIFGFFGDKETPAEPSDASTSSTPTTSSGLSVESTESEGDPLM